MHAAGRLPHSDVNAPGQKPADPGAKRTPGASSFARQETELETRLKKKMAPSQVHWNCIGRSISVHPKTGRNRAHSPIPVGLASRQAPCTVLPCWEKRPIVGRGVFLSSWGTGPYTLPSTPTLKGGDSVNLPTVDGLLTGYVPKAFK